MAEKQGSTFTAAYAYGNALIRKDGEYPMFDGLGSTRTVGNSSQTVTATARHEAFGQTLSTTGSTSNPYGFAGRRGYRTDGDAGLMHVGARYYDAQVGRFITRDALLDQHPYLYCEHDPVNLVDPSGRIQISVGYSATGSIPTLAAGADVQLIIDLPSWNPRTWHIGYGYHAAAGCGSGFFGSIGPFVGISSGRLSNGVDAGLLYGVGAGLADGGSLNFGMSSTGSFWGTVALNVMPVGISGGSAAWYMGYYGRTGVWY